MPAFKRATTHVDFRQTLHQAQCPNTKTAFDFREPQHPWCLLYYTGALQSREPRVRACTERAKTHLADDFIMHAASEAVRKSKFYGAFVPNSRVGRHGPLLSAWAY